MPRGLPWDPARNHLAVHTEDHPLEYLTFEGHIPEGSYGAGMMTVWDTGTYVAEKIEDRKLVVVLEGERSRGRYALFQTDGRNWMIHRMDPPEDPARRHPPERFSLVEAEPGPAPSGGGWALETRWQGQRCVLTSGGGRPAPTRPAGGWPATNRWRSWPSTCCGSTATRWASGRGGSGGSASTSWRWRARRGPRRRPTRATRRRWCRPPPRAGWRRWWPSGSTPPMTPPCARRPGASSECPTPTTAEAVERGRRTPSTEVE